ncbi:hypothetical protein NUW58_g444 [Xylaria curta]|uniref:Uncharacterized protein n=1 Tax=Xylaria curta TaxID=42375 RepID=A0ACC1PP78_9PEZI|nr:hypothetical protein NUW58_g444 [Xylaria curta]
MDSGNSARESSPVMPRGQKGNSNDESSRRIKITIRNNKGLGIGTKRKNPPSDSSTKPNPSKRRRPGVRELNSRKAELGKQFGNIIEWASRRHGVSEGSEYTSDQYESDETQLREAKLVLKNKMKSEGQENDYPNELFRIEGMLTTIRDYQAVGTSFMFRQERSQIRGGILADDMGIGKTVQSIACMLANPPTKTAEQEHRGATLIIVPNQGLVKQWTEELKKHAKVKKKDVCRYAGGGKIHAHGIKGYPYVLATYGQVERDYRLHREQNEEDEGPLFEVEFYRIILDEGDNIKNYNGNTSKACCALEGKLKWVLSGTPLRNSIKECLPYFRFLRIDAKENSDDFTKKWKAPKTASLSSKGDMNNANWPQDSQENRIMQILASIMLRREAGQVFLGRGMCGLPKSYFDDRVVPVTAQEAIVTKHMEQATVRAQNEYRQLKLLRQNLDVPKGNHQVRCIRLRQAADHLFLLEKHARDLFNEIEIKNLVRALEKQKQPSIYDVGVDLKTLIEDIHSPHEEDGCLECFSMAELRSLICGHTMCRICYVKHVEVTIEQDKKQCKCPRCGKVISELRKAPNNKRLVREESVKLESEVLRNSRGRDVSVIPTNEENKRSLGNDCNGIEPLMKPYSCRWLEQCDKSSVVVPSTKTNTAAEIVKGWQKEAPDDKIIIFTEWIGTAKILGRMLNRIKIPFVYYLGGQTTLKNRDTSLQNFRSNAKIKVMISTMATGNLGLNLTVANRMIIMNPWWNYAAEAQAFGRIKRHGQTKETFVVRLFAKGTIDERILKMQDRKKLEIAGAMSQGKIPKLLSPEDRYFLETGSELPHNNPDTESATDDGQNSDD